MDGKRSLVVLALAAASLGMSQATYAQCSIPHTLTNGQVADAAEVMDDIQAIADCVDSAPAGSANSIQTKGASGGFSGIGPLTNGQVVVGATGAAPQAATITAGSGITVTNGAGAITISTSGGPRGGGLYDISMGVPTSFTNVNIGSNSSIVTNGSLALTVKTGGASPTSPTLYGVSVPVPSTTPYMVAVLVTPNAPPIKFNGPAVGFYDSTTSKLLVLASLNGSAFGDPGFSFEEWSSATSRATYNEPSVPKSAAYGPTWFGIKDDGTTVSFLMSMDGANYYPLPFSQTKSSGYLSAYDHIFLGMFISAEAGSDGSANDYTSVTYYAYDPDGLNRLAGP